MANPPNPTVSEELAIDPKYRILEDVAPTAEAMAAPGEEAQPSLFWALVRELVETVVLSLILFLIIRQVVQNYRIESHSMEPNFFEGQFVLVNKLAYKLGDPQRGEVLVFHNPQLPDEEDFIKRIIGLPGDTVELRDDKVYVNGQLLPEPFNHNLMPSGYSWGPLVVQSNTLFVMGDNRPNSKDSRVIGPIDEKLVVGKAWLRVWPLDLMGFVEHYQLQPGG
jgi:signal peptidase I